MELEDLVVYNSNIAYHVHTEDIQQQHINATINYNKVKSPIKSNRVLNKNNILIIMIVILLLIAIILTVLSVVTISQLNSKQSTLSSQLSKANDDIVAVLTQLAMIHNNASQKFFQFDTKINNLISFLLQNTDMEPQSNCIILRLEYTSTSSELEITIPSHESFPMQCTLSWVETGVLANIPAINVGYYTKHKAMQN